MALSKWIKSSLERGLFDAAEMRFAEYLSSRVQVVETVSLEAIWQKYVAEKREQLTEQERRKEEEQAARMKGGKLRRWISGSAALPNESS